MLKKKQKKTRQSECGLQATGGKKTLPPKKRRGQKIRKDKNKQKKKYIYITKIKTEKKKKKRKNRKKKQEQRSVKKKGLVSP